MDQFQIINSEMTLVWTYQHLRTSCLQEFPYTLADFQSADLHSRMDDLLCSHRMHTSLKLNVKFKLWFDYSHKIWTIMPIEPSNQLIKDLDDLCSELQTYRIHFRDQGMQSPNRHYNFVRPIADDWIQAIHFHQSTDFLYSLFSGSSGCQTKAMNLGPWIIVLVHDS